MQREALKNWNPWWATGTVPKEKTGIPRQQYLKKTKLYLDKEEITCLAGVRRSGKTTIIYQTIHHLLTNKTKPQNILFINLDDPAFEKKTTTLDQIMNTYLETNNPTGKKYIFLDEIQNMPEWERWLKKEFDLKKGVKFFVSGSNSTILSSEYSSLLTGRILKINVMPLSFKEYLQFRGITVKDLGLEKQKINHSLREYIKIGGFPRVTLEKNKEVRTQLLREYYNSILLHDILKRNEVKYPSKLTELAQFCVSNTANPISYQKIGKAIGLSADTVKEYLTLMEKAFLIFQENFFSFSVKQSIALQKPRKLFFIDTGLRNAVGFKFSPDLGRLMENIVFIELLRREETPYYWANKKEVDFVTMKGTNITSVINVCFDTKKAGQREIDGLIEFLEKNNLKKATILTWNEEETKKIRKKTITLIPLAKWLLNP